MATVVDLARPTQYTRDNEVGGGVRNTIIPASASEQYVHSVDTSMSTGAEGLGFPLIDPIRITYQTLARTPGAAEPDPVRPYT